MAKGPETETEDIQRAPRRRRGARWLKIALVILLLLAVAGLLAPQLLRISAVRTAILSRVATAVASGLGIEAHADDFALDIGARRLVLDNVTLARPGQRPFLRVPVVTAELVWGELLRAPRRIERLTLERPVWDIDAPVAGEAEPIPEEVPAKEGPAALVAPNIVVTGGSVVSERPPPGFERWYTAWQWQSLDGTGAFENGFRLHFASAPLVLEPVAADAVPEAAPGVRLAFPDALALAGGFDWSADGVLAIEDVVLTGDGLDLRGAGRGRFGAGEQFFVDAHLESQPGRFLDGVAADSRLVAETSLEVNELVGKLDAEGQLVPAEVLRPYLAGFAPTLALEGTALGFDVDFDLGGRDPAATRGSGKLVWRRGDQVLLVAEGSVLEAPRDADELRLALDARLLPSRPGAPSARGTLVAPSLDRLRELRFDDLTVALDTPDAAALISALDDVTPGLTAALPAELRSGALAARAILTGAPASPDIDLQATWRPAAGEQLTLEANGRLLDGDGRFDLAIENFAAGRLRADWQETVIDRARLAATARGGRITIGQATLTAGERSAAVTGSLGLDLARGWPAVRLRSADLGIEADAPVPGLTHLAGRLGLQQGVLTIESFSGDTTAGSFAADGRIPLGGLAGWPTLSDLVAERVTLLVPGRAALHLRVPAFESAAWLALLGIAPQPAAVAGDLTLDLDLDPAAPAAGEAHLVLDGAALAFGERFLQASGPLRANLDGGRLTLEPVTLSGHDLSLAASGATAIDPGWRPGRDLLAALEPIRLSLAAVPGPDGQPTRLRWQAVADLLGIDPGPLEATADFSLEVDLEPGRAAASSGRLRLGRVEGTLSGQRLTVDNLEAILEGGVIRLGPAQVAAAEQLVSVTAEAPLDLTALGGASIGDWLGPVTVELAAGPALLGDDAPPLRPGRLLELFGGAEADAAATAAVEETSSLGGSASTSLEAHLEIDLGAPMSSRGELRLIDLVLESGARTLQAREDVVVRLGDQRLSLGPARFESPAAPAPLEIGATVELADRWPQDAVLAELVESVSLRAEGMLQAGILNPYLAAYLGGASARGPVRLDIEIVGPPGDLRGRALLEAPEAEILVARPYFAQVRNLHLALTLADGGVEVANGSARLNQGTVELGGTRGPDGDLELTADFEDVRLRVDYGLTMVLDGKLQYRQPVRGALARLSGDIEVKRGQVRRYIDPDRELLRRLFGGPELSNTASPLLRSIELDLDIRTRDGVRIKNNLADLRAAWTELEVRGTLAEPRIRGRIDLDPRGYLFAYGQAVRLDRGSLIFHGDPNIEPELDVVITTAAEDPTVGREGASRFPAALRPDDDASERRSAALTSSVADYYLNRLAGQLGSSIGAFNLAIGEELLIFGETDPSRRLTIGRDISSHVSLAASFALGEEGDTTYVLDLHDFAFAERVVAQVFTTDDEDQGTTLQQIFERGRPPASADEVRLRGFDIEVPEHIGRKKIKRATSYGKGDLMPRSADFDLAVDIGEALRQGGYPGAQVDVSLEPLRDIAVVARVEVDPGPRVAYEFEGDTPPRRARRAVRTIYRPDLYEPATLAEIEIETERAMLAEGYLDPQVEVAVEVEDPEQPGSLRTVVVRTTGGDKSKLAEPRFLGVGDPVAEVLAAQFGDPLSRARLLADDPDMRAAVEAELRDLGFPRARIESIGRDAGHAVVSIAAGPRQVIGSVRIEGLAAAEAEARLTELELAAGEPARRDSIARAAVRLERTLREEGRAAARVRSQIGETEGGMRLDIVLRVENPEIYRIADVVFEGRHATRRRWAERATGLEEGDLVVDEEIADARRSLYEIGAFTAVVPRTELRDDGTGVITIDVEERARYRYAIGGRWASSQGLATVIDVLDRNGFGRGVRLGVRTRYASDDQSLRFFGSVPNVFGTKSTLDLFVEGRERSEGRRMTSRAESTLQVSVPHGEKTTSRYYLRYSDQSVSDVLVIPGFGEIEINQRVELPVIGFQWLRDSRDDRIEPRRGTFFSLDLSATDESLSSDLTFLRLLVQASHFRTIGHFRERPIVLAQSLRVGLADTFDESSLFREERFFAGGEFSVRGYKEDSLGPQGPTEDGTGALGGEGLLVLNQELRLPITDTFVGVLFFDAGNVYLDPADLGKDLAMSVGLGLRARTPIGLVRGDIAFPLDAPAGADDLELYLGFGYSF